MRRYRAMLTMMSDDATAAKLDALQNAAALELNPRHPIVRGIQAARGSDDEATRRVAKLAAEQVFDNARVAAGGALDDPRRWSRAYTISWRWRWRRRKSDASRDARAQSERDGARRVKSCLGSESTSATNGDGGFANRRVSRRVTSSSQAAQLSALADTRRQNFHLLSQLTHVTRWSWARPLTGSAADNTCTCAVCTCRT